MRVALITGASSGIGLATSRMFVEAGIAVVGVARDPEKNAAMEKELAGGAVPVVTLSADVRDDDTPRRAVELAIERFGRLDHLVNNAGIGSPKPVHETDDDTLDLFLDVMLRSPFRFCREALKIFGREATIVNVSSTYALVGGLRGGAYSAAKAGINGLTTHLACQYGSSGIRTNAVAPGVVATPMTAHRMADERFRRMNVDMTPATRLGTPEDVAQAIFFLSSPASSWINGQVLAVDGGWSTTKFLTEEALSAERRSVTPDWTHSGRSRSHASELE
ncbi:SDR family NAD(P)-dependent oxidoreductase [Mesorhizobium australicum]|uniref:NAD(P)-dependent dehydrogenase, short-chain alcohol dehydrogenase family n=1 Tax=Mesorhizobium australicum TaxID=536018 RepID=A0A1X7PLI2_9HYPH|nr:SDR family oxidoreductase [Mesorhizobium australicum]SMH51695.1 NAD(P)-dependent dehydrogenase, short-chain alcohol dehydrogenase family [Mesorhizobium australicum]